MKQRRCRPGFRCFDGCNWTGCNGRGSAFIETLLECEAWFFDLEFEPGSSKLRSTPDWQLLLERIQPRLRSAERRVLVEGYADPAEKRPQTAAEQLAKARAELIRQLLVRRGVPAARVNAGVGNVQRLRNSNHSGHLARVRMSLEPKQALREDFDPGSEEFRLHCGQ